MIFQRNAISYIYSYFMPVFTLTLFGAVSFFLPRRKVQLLFTSKNPEATVIIVLKKEFLKCVMHANPKLKFRGEIKLKSSLIQIMKDITLDNFLF